MSIYCTFFYRSLPRVCTITFLHSLEHYLNTHHFSEALCIVSSYSKTLKCGLFHSWKVTLLYCLLSFLAIINTIWVLETHNDLQLLSLYSKLLYSLPQPLKLTQKLHISHYIISNVRQLVIVRFKSFSWRPSLVLLGGNLGQVRCKQITTVHTHWELPVDIQGVAQ